MNNLNKFGPLIARIFLSAIFLMSAYGKITGFEGTAGFMASVGMPATGLLLVCAIILELGGGLSVLFGYKAKWGALALIVFLVPATLIFHTNFADQSQIQAFLKNLGLLGGLIMVMVHGSGPCSVDRQKKK